MNLKYRCYNDLSLRDCAIAFVEAMAKNSSLTKNISFEEKKGLVIVKIQLSEKFENFRVDIIFRIFSQLTFPKNEDLVCQYLKIYPQARPLYLIIRLLLYKAKLDNPATHGINNFSLFLMIVAFCQKFSSGIQTTIPYSKTQIQSLVDLRENQEFNSQISTPNFASSFPKEPIVNENQPFFIPQNNSGTDFPKTPQNTGDLLLKLLYFFGYTFDYINSYICPFIPGDDVQESFFTVS